MASIKLFGQLAEILGHTVEIDFSDKSFSRTEILGLLAIEFPLHADIIKKCNVAVNQQYIFDEKVDVTNTEIAIIPPVSGG